MSAGYRVWQDLGPGSGVAFAEGQEGLSDEHVTDLYRGRPLAEPFPDVRITYLGDGELGDLVGSAFSTPLVSPAIRAVLERAAPGAVQFVPVELANRPGAGYALLNVVASVPRLTAGRDVPPDAPPIAKVDAVPGAVFVRDDLREELEGTGGSVGEFLTVDEYEREYT